MVIDDELAAVIYDLAHSMDGPLSREEAGLNFRRARVVAKMIDKALDDEGVDPDDLERPEIPLLVPGSKYVTPQDPPPPAPSRTARKRGASSG
jgi:hypothetical protein